MSPRSRLRSQAESPFLPNMIVEQLIPEAQSFGLGVPSSPEGSPNYIQSLSANGRMMILHEVVEKVNDEEIVESDSNNVGGSPEERDA